jgi:hypothetical protein
MYEDMLWDWFEANIMSRRVGGLLLFKWISNKLWYRTQTKYDKMHERLIKTRWSIIADDPTPESLYLREADAVMNRMLQGYSTLDYAFKRISEIHKQLTEQQETQGL